MAAPANLPPALLTEIPGPGSRALAKRLAEVETRDVTCLDPIPIFWRKSSGANVWDVDGNRFVDLTSAFGVANVGHSHPRVVAAMTAEAQELLHGMGDVYPGEGKVALLEALAARFPGGGPARATLSSSGSDAVETAIKTAMLATGRRGILAFEGSYHGLSFGALSATQQPFFRNAFESRLPKPTCFARFDDLDDVRRALEEAEELPAAIVVEPILGRGGEVVPSPTFLPGLRDLCDDRGLLLIADEVYTGFGRTGRLFACEHDAVVPDLLCLGKGMSSGMPISACLGRASVMDAWPRSQGEALHTQTFLGHPPGCAAALASLAVLEEEGLVERAAELGETTRAFLTERLGDFPGVREIRGRGLMLGIACEEPQVSLAAWEASLVQGIILLPSGTRGEVLSITPPLMIGEEVLLDALERLVKCFGGKA
jgi:4-aminobutyrate aminotransferase-like enzyme